MVNDAHYPDLVRKAQFGERGSLDRLAQLSRERLYAYIYRLTLDHDLTQDLLQETLFEMLKSLKDLKKPEAFWSWLFRIASSKVQHYYRDKQRKRTVQMSVLDREYLSKRASAAHSDEMNNMVRQELAHAIFEAMRRLKPRHRNILILRCFEEMPYPEIATVMNGSELQMRVLFFRAKNSLKKYLSRCGLSKTMLLSGLGLFGQMTAPAEAAPTTVTVTASSTKVGLTATVVATIATRLGATIAAMIVAVALTVGSITTLKSTDGITARNDKEPLKRASVKSVHYVEQAWDNPGGLNANLARGRSLSKGAYEQWFYFPEGADGPTFMMMQRWDPQQTNRLCGWLQNSKGNYYYHAGEKTIYLYDYHLPLRDLRTRRLPTDTVEFTEFLDQIEGKPPGITYTRDPKTGLLLGALDDRFYNAKDFESSFSYNTLTETSFHSFRYPWPPDTPVIDERDAMHKRGWTYFRITGELLGQTVEGYGRIPFIYDTLHNHQPWLRLNIGNALQIVDTPSAAYLATPAGTLIAAYPPGTFFKGLARPWMGIHTIDLIRRDAAEKKIPFSIKSFGGNGNYYGKAEITLIAPAGQPQIKIVHTIDIDKDITEKIEFLVEGDSSQSNKGVLRFQYLQQTDYLSDEFTEPAEINIPGTTSQDDIGVLWLIELAQGTLGQ